MRGNEIRVISQESGIMIRPSRNVYNTRKCCKVLSEARTTSVWSGLPLHCRAKHNDIWLNLFQDFIPQSHPFHSPSREVLNNHICPGYEFFSYLFSPGMGQVNTQAAFARVNRIKMTAAIKPRDVIFEGRHHRSFYIRSAPAFYLNHLSTTISQSLGSQRAYVRPGEISNLYPFEDIINNFDSPAPILRTLLDNSILAKFGEPVPGDAQLIYVDFFIVFTDKRGTAVNSKYCFCF